MADPRTTQLKHFDASEVQHCLCLQSRRAARRLTQIYDHALHASGLRVTQFQLLAAIGEAEPVTQQTLADIMGMDRTTLTRNLGLLQREGLVRIEPGREDRREHRHSLSKAGRKAVAKALPMWRTVQQHLTEQLLAEEGAPARDAVFHLLGTLGTLADG